MVIVLFIFLLVLSAFFSSSETAFFNIKKHHKISNRVKYLLKNPRELLTFILIGNTLVNIAIATLAANYTINVLVSRYSNFSKEELLFYEVIKRKKYVTRNSSRVSRWNSNIISIHVNS